MLKMARVLTEGLRPEIACRQAFHPQLDYRVTPFSFCANLTADLAAWRAGIILTHMLPAPPHVTRDDAPVPDLHDSYKFVEPRYQAVGYVLIAGMFPAVAAAAAMVPLGACMGIVGGTVMAMNGEGLLSVALHALALCLCGGCLIMALLANGAGWSCGCAITHGAG